ASTSMISWRISGCSRRSSQRRSSASWKMRARSAARSRLPSACRMSAPKCSAICASAGRPCSTTQRAAWSAFTRSMPSWTKCAAAALLPLTMQPVRPRIQGFMAGSASVFGVVTQEHQLVRAGLFRAEAIALVGEVLEARRVADAFLDHVAGHQAAGLLGVEADDLVLAVLQVAELGVDHPRPEGLALHSAEILVGGQVEQHVVA